MESIKSYSNKDVELKNKTTEGLNLVIDKEILDDQRTLEVGTKLPEKAKVDSEDKTDFETFKVVYKGAIDDKCLEEFGTMDDTKLWEDTAKEMFLKSSEYIPEEDKKADGELEKKTEGRTLKEDQSKAKELEFSSLEFEKQIPHVMRWKEWSVVNDLDLYWITQQFFNEEDVTAFAEAFKSTGFDKAFVTVRDLSTYEYDRDLANKVFVVVNKDGTYDMTDYLNTCKSEGYDKSLYESKEVKIESSEDETYDEIEDRINGYLGNPMFRGLMFEVLTSAESENIEGITFDKCKEIADKLYNTNAGEEIFDLLYAKIKELLEEKPNVKENKALKVLSRKISEQKKLAKEYPKQITESIVLSDREKEILRDRMRDTVKNLPMFKKDKDGSQLEAYLDDFMPMWITAQQNLGQHLTESAPIELTDKDKEDYYYGTTRGALVYPVYNKNGKFYDGNGYEISKEEIDGLDFFKKECPKHD